MSKYFTDLNGIFSMLNTNGYINTSKWYSHLNRGECDIFLNNHIGRRELVMPLQNANDDLERSILIGNIINSYNFKLDGLYETMLHDSEVSPVDNVNEQRAEHRVVKNEYGDQDKTNTYGNIQQTNTYGSSTQTNTYGEQTTTNVIASRTNSDSIGQQSNSNTNSTTFGAKTTTENIGNGTDTHTTADLTTAFDTTDYEKATVKSVLTDVTGAKTNTVGVNSYTDSSTGSDTIGSRSDSHTLGGGTDTSTLGTYTDTIGISKQNDTIGTTRGNDTEKLKHGDDETTEDYTVNRHGNIGVTMTGQIIEDYRGYHNFNLYSAIQEIIEHEFIKSFVYDY